MLSCYMSDRGRRWHVHIVFVGVELVPPYQESRVTHRYLLFNIYTNSSLWHPQSKNIQKPTSQVRPHEGLSFFSESILVYPEFGCNKVGTFNHCSRVPFTWRYCKAARPSGCFISPRLV